MKTRIFVTTLFIAVAMLSWPRIGAAQCSSFNGRSTVVQANGLNIVPVVLSDTGSLDSTGGEKDTSLPGASIPGLISGEALFATAIAESSFSEAEASIGGLNLTVAGNTIGADFVIARANADCGGAVPTVNPTTQIDGLVVNGLPIAVTGQANQTVSLLGGAFMILNEQTSSLQSLSGNLSMNAIHVTVPGVEDVFIASPSVSVAGPFSPTTAEQCTCAAAPGQCFGFFTGGGWIRSVETNEKATFGVAGGIRRDGTLFARLEYIDHGRVPETGFTPMKVHGTEPAPAPPYGPSATCQSSGREISGFARVNGSSTCTLPGGGGTVACQYTVDVCDSDDNVPSSPDSFGIFINNNYVAFNPLTGANLPLGAGNIELHSCQ